MPRNRRIGPLIIAVIIFFGLGPSALPSAEGAIRKSPSPAPRPKKAAKKSAAKKVKKKNASKAKFRARVISKRGPRNPAEFVQERVDSVYTALMSRPPRVLPSTRAFVGTSSQKGPWLSSVYAQNLVEASSQTEKLSDKLIMYRVLEQALGPAAQGFYPRTIGLKEFLHKHGLIDGKGRITAGGERVEQALYSEFPAGFVVRPAVGVAPQETRQGLYPEGDAFVTALVEGKFPGYEPKHFRAPVRSHILDDVASGEAVVLQDDIVLRADAKKKLGARTFREIRVHTYENKVVADSVPTRWVQTTKMDDEDARAVEAYVSKFLSGLPARLLTRQAWGVDVAVFDNGEMLITDIVTNRGRRIQWSSYLEQPRILGAYARHFEKEAGVEFGGVAGALIRNNFGNYFSYWDARIEKSRPGWRKLMSYLPPVP